MTKKTSETIDMSPGAVAARLEQVRSLYLLGMSLSRARILGPAAPAPDDSTRR
jgi:hypothetical protein